MLNPKNASKSPLSSRVALPIALMLAGTFGLCISIVQPVSVVKKEDPAPTGITPQAENSFDNLADARKSTPSAAAPLDLVGFCSRNVTEKRSFVVFKRGTCVVVTEPCADPTAEARKILAHCKDADARFVTEPTTEGEMIVAFKDPVFHRFSQKELEKLQAWLKQPATALLSPAESVAAGDDWVPPVHAKVGLLARRWMLEDAANAVPVKIIRAKERALASN